MTWLTRIFSSSERGSQTKDSSPKKDIPEGLWSQCDNCQSVLYRGDLERHLNICSQCGHHMYISAKQRLTSFVDENSMIEFAKDIVPVDHLKFRDIKRYKDRLSQAQKKTEQKDALLVVEGLLYGMTVVACAFEYGFIGGSMGVAVGDRFVCAAKRAMEKHCPFICFAASGGARMQEGVLSLMQMAKTSAVLARFADCGLPFISVLTNPTMGGVSASLAMLGDIIIAEPKALIGFTGPRVIKQTVKQVLPEGFQCSEFLLEHGAIDMIMDRRQMRFGIGRLLAKLMGVSQPVLEESE